MRVDYVLYQDNDWQSSEHFDAVRVLADLLGMKCRQALIVECRDLDLQPAIEHLIVGRGMPHFVHFPISPVDPDGVIDEDVLRIAQGIGLVAREMEQSIADGEKALDEMQSLVVRGHKHVLTESARGTAMEDSPLPKDEAGHVEVRPIPTGFAYCEICGDLFKQKRKKSRVCEKDACKLEAKRRYQRNYMRGWTKGDEQRMNKDEAIEVASHEASTFGRAARKEETAEKVYEVLTGKHTGEWITSHELGIYLKIERYEPGTIIRHKTRGEFVIMRSGKHSKVVRHKCGGKND